MQQPLQRSVEFPGRVFFGCQPVGWFCCSRGPREQRHVETACNCLLPGRHCLLRGASLRCCLPASTNRRQQTCAEHTQLPAQTSSAAANLRSRMKSTHAAYHHWYDSRLVVSSCRFAGSSQSITDTGARGCDDSRRPQLHGEPVLRTPMMGWCRREGLMVGIHLIIIDRPN